MSKQSEAENDRIPSYEESIATSPPPALPATKSSRKISPRQTIQQRTRQERVRRIAALVSNHIDPTISNHLEDGTTKFVIVILPSDSFPTGNSTNLSTSSITSPTVTLPATLLNLRSSLRPDEREEDYKGSFLAQGATVHDLTTFLHQSLLDPSALPSSQHPSSGPTLAFSAELPPRPPAKSWFQRKFGLPLADHDPTGSTGAWNLGWRSEEDSSSTQASVTTDEVSITTRLQDVTFRTENEMGLLESRSVKCLWLEMDLRS